MLKYIQPQNNVAKRKTAYATHRVVGISMKERCHSKMAFAGITDKKFNTCSLGNIVGKWAIIISVHVSSRCRTDIFMLPTVLMAKF